MVYGKIITNQQPNLYQKLMNFTFFHKSFLEQNAFTSEERASFDNRTVLPVKFKSTVKN